MSRDDIECKYCGEEGLHWRAIGFGHKLHNEEGEAHVCPPQDVADDFDD